jgi:hypothetical protein
MNDLTSPTSQGLYLFFSTEMENTKWPISYVSEYLGLNANRPQKIIDSIAAGCEQLVEIGVIDKYNLIIPENRKAEKFLEIIPGKMLLDSQSKQMQLEFTF